MRLYDLAMNIPWAATEETVRLILDILAREQHDVALAAAIRAERASRPSALAAQAGRPLDGTRGVVVRDGVAILDVTGPIVRRADFFTEMSGGASVETLAQDFRQALTNTGVTAILLAIDSPGGEVTGVNEFAQMVMDARAEKPIWAYIEGLGASAAYWIASAAEQVVMDATAAAGSIGVVMAVRDPAKAKTDRIEFVSSQSPHKRPDPGTETGKSQLQTIVDDTAAVFVAAVARQRGVSDETVLNDFGAGGLLVGHAAVAAGLADRLGSFEGTLAAIRQAAAQRAPRPRLAAQQGDTIVKVSDMWRGFFQAAKSEGIPIEADEAHGDLVAGELLVAPADPRVADLEAQLAALQQQGIERDAAAFADALIADRKALPAERAALIAAYTTAAQADHAVANLGMVAALRAREEARSTHALTQELIPAGPLAVLGAERTEDDLAAQGRAQGEAYAKQANKK